MNSVVSITDIFESFGKIKVYLNSARVFYSHKEKGFGIKVFTKKAHDYLRSFIPPECFLSKNDIRKAFPSLSFGAAVESNEGVALLNFATGSNDNYYINSLCKSQTSFQIVKKMNVDFKIADRILLIDDQKESMDSDKVGLIVKFIRDEGICDK